MPNHRLLCNLRFVSTLTDKNLYHQLVLSFQAWQVYKETSKSKVTLCLCLNWLVTEVFYSRKLKLNLHVNERYKRWIITNHHLFFFPKCQDKNLALFFPFLQCSQSVKRMFRVVTIVEEQQIHFCRSGWFLAFFLSWALLKCQITTRDKSKTRFFCLFFPFILRVWQGGVFKSLQQRAAESLRFILEIFYTNWP